LTADAKLHGLADLARAYGHTALMLNSTASFGLYLLGVIRALHEAHLLPRIIFGRSTGALAAAFICCRADAATALDFDQIDVSAFAARGGGGFKRRIRRLFESGTLMDVDVLQRFARDNIGDLTFLEAYQLTGRVLNIYVGRYNAELGREAGWLLNYLTAPNVVVHSAATASCATTGLYAPVPLLSKMRDGTIVRCDPWALQWTGRIASFTVNSAIERLRGLFNVNFFLVADATLLHAPFLRARGSSFLEKFVHFFTEEFWRFVAYVSRLVPTRFTGFLQTVGEPVEGDVCLLPLRSVTDGLRMLRNPTRSVIDECVRRGAQTVWPRLEQIRTNLLIEQALTEAQRKVWGSMTPRDVALRAGSALEHFDF
jgi:TAG lipase/lysophosphatidylethanolamine acyltransferase